MLLERIRLRAEPRVVAAVIAPAPSPRETLGIEAAIAAAMEKVSACADGTSPVAPLRYTVEERPRARNCKRVLVRIRNGTAGRTTVVSPRPSAGASCTSSSASERLRPGAGGDEALDGGSTATASTRGPRRRVTHAFIDAKGRKGTSIQRCGGLGEMSAETALGDHDGR